jgi:ATP-dependent protease HslVU (ClpYQ) peptidase subunit
MSCIVGYVDDDGTVYVGGDSLSTDDDGNQRFYREPKVMKRGSFLIGFCGDYCYGQALLYMDIPDQRANQSDIDYMRMSFVKELKAEMKEQGFDDFGECIVGYKGNLYCIANDLHVSQAVENYNACGAGEQYALGALYLLSKMEGVTTNDKVDMALKAAAEYCYSVKQPFAIRMLSPTEGRRDGTERTSGKRKRGRPKLSTTGTYRRV